MDAPIHPLAPELLADAMPQLVWVATSDGTVEYYNARVADYAGAVRDERGWHWEPMVHPDDLADTAAAWSAAVTAASRFEHEHRMQMADGSWRWHLSRALPLQESPGAPVRWYGTATDVHDLRRAQDQVSRVQGSLGLAMRGGRMGWWGRDLVTNEVTWSEELEAIVGLPPGGFANQGGDEDAFFALVHPDDRAAVAEAVETAVRTGDDYTIEFRYRHAGGTWRWMEGRGRAVEAGGRPAWLFGLGMDIHDRKLAEGVREVFLGMLSHELRTPVTAIYGGAQLLRRDLLPDALRREITADLVAESERLERLVENLLVVARVERRADLGGRDPIILRPLVARVVDGERRHSPAATVEVAVEPGLPPAMGDEASVELVLRNILSNALKYGPPDGPVRVEAATGDGGVVVRVVDRGPGIAAGDLQRVFDLFYRAEASRRAAPGAGIGLYVVRTLVEAMGGRVSARPADGGGMEIGFALPVFTEAADGGRGDDPA